ncbi:MAG: hypothetical protein IRZ00_05350 [Gemmatimonadetes bacterium]|nr:hypothetical protein [Gemmatimonadota bacterium]
MSMATAERRGGSAALWFGLLGAAAAWSVQEIVAYAIVAHSCYPRMQPLAVPSLVGTWGLALAVTLAALLVALASLGTALRLWRAARPLPHAAGNDWSAETEEPDEGGAGRYLAFSGVLLGAIFTALIAYNAIAIVLVPVCGW